MRHNEKGHLFYVCFAIIAIICGRTGESEVFWNLLFTSWGQTLIAERHKLTFSSSCHGDVVRKCEVPDNTQMTSSLTSWVRRRGTSTMSHTVHSGKNWCVSRCHMTQVEIHNTPPLDVSRCRGFEGITDMERHRLPGKGITAGFSSCKLLVFIWRDMNCWWTHCCCSIPQAQLTGQCSRTH